MERAVLFKEEHVIFREIFRKFVKNEIEESYPKWEEDGVVPRDLWEKFGLNGYLLPWAAEEYGGAGADFLYSVIISEELARAGAGSVFVPLHNDIVAPYIDSFASAEQKKRWFPSCISGKAILAIAMTEPGAGSDLAAMKTKAERKGDYWVLNGHKTFISNGSLADLVIVAAKIKGADNGHHAVSLFMVERGMPGFTRSEPIKKIGLKAQDTVELFFDDCLIPEENMIGEEGMGFIYLMQKLQQERLVAALGAQAAVERCLEMTMEYAKERILFGKPLSKFQNTRFVFAEIASENAVGRSFIDDLIVNHMKGQDVIKETCMAKYWICEAAKRNIDRCLQIFGGYGYCLEYPISRFYLDARIQTIYAGTSEVMKLIVSRSLGL